MPPRHTSGGSSSCGSVSSGTICPAPCRAAAISSRVSSAAPPRHAPCLSRRGGAQKGACGAAEGIVHRPDHGSVCAHGRIEVGALLLQPLVRRLERDGLVKAAPTSDTARQTWKIARTGRAQLEDWYAEPVADDPPARDELAIKHGTDAGHSNPIWSEPHP